MHIRWSKPLTNAMEIIFITQIYHTVDFKATLVRHFVCCRLSQTFVIIVVCLFLYRNQQNRSQNKQPRCVHNSDYLCYHKLVSSEKRDNCSLDKREINHTR